MTTFKEEKIILRTDYLPFADSNKLEAPNDHVLLEFLPRFITFRNVKTNQETIRDLRSFKDIFGSTYNVKEFYKEQYDGEISEDGLLSGIKKSKSHFRVLCFFIFSQIFHIIGTVKNNWILLFERRKKIWK